MELFNLIAADFKRIKKDKALRTILIINIVVLICIAAFFLWTRNLVLAAVSGGGLLGEAGGLEGLDELQQMDAEELKSLLNSGMALMTYQLTLSTGLFGLFMTIALAIFIGSEFSFNTIRNKIISGNSRVKIYLSTYLSALLIGLIFYAINIAAQFIITSMFFGFISTDGLLVKTALLTILPYASIIAIVCFISMTVKSRSLGIVLNILVLILVPQFISGLAGLNPDSKFLTAVTNGIPYTILSQLLSYSTDTAEIGRLIKFGGIDSGLVLRAILIPPFFMAAFCALGAYLFKRADIK